ncbi:MAG: ATPase, T2SS/T4P/T4SS family, partial [Phycisphaerae bacterium]
SIHRVHSQILSYESLNLPEVYQQTITRYVEGLILVSGVSGSGKSSTLAAMVEQINQTRSVHIITIEDPIEFTFTPRRSIISQREIGIDVPNYREALRYLARQDPDCIVMGEMRDREIMLAALEAAETGHLVLGSLPLADVQQTFARFLESFPPSDHAFVRTSLANNLRAIMCQRLVPGMDEGTYWPATEVLLRNPAVKDRILHEKGEDLASVIAQHEGEGMRSFTTSLCELIKAEKVHYDTAMDCAPYPEALDAAVKGIKTEQ